MTEHLPEPGCETHERNGTSGNTVVTDDGLVDIEVPRDCERSYEPPIVGKHERRATGFDQKIITKYARDMTVREIQGYLAEMYGSEVSPDFSAKSPTR